MMWSVRWMAGGRNDVVWYRVGCRA
jgi:hypothetical protein